jgi:hypothetical protein
MAKGSGGTRGASGGGGKSSRSNGLADKYLGGVNNDALKKDLSEGLAQFEKEFGLPEGLTISMGDIGAAGKINGLNQMVLNSGYDKGTMSKSDARKTLLHELTHGIDKTDTHRTKNISRIDEKNGSLKGVLKKENKGFDKKLTAAYKHFKSNYGTSATKQIGSYALKSKHEFFAEALSSHLTGTQNKYTTFAYNLAKSMTGK